VPGVVAILIVLVLFPVLFLMGMTVVAVVLGSVLNHDAEVRNEGSELLDLNV
jgi:flagellar basal body-associated protein FliL